MIKRILISLLRYVLHFRYIYNLVDFMGYQSRRAIKQYAEKKFIELLAPHGSAKVLHGPFKGMIYPQMHSVGSELTPKIIGSYESELHSVLESVCNKDYAQVVDIGAAEGYYAIGLALRIPGVKVNVFETNTRGIELCKHMAIANKVDDRIVFKGECDVNQLALLEFNQGHKGFVICDCEGCELEILDPKLIPQLAHCDLLVEVHDFTTTGLSSFEIINSRFLDTHKIRPINVKRRDPKYFIELEKFNELEISSVLSEQRVHSVGWMFIESISC